MAVIEGGGSHHLAYIRRGELVLMRLGANGLPVSEPAALFHRPDGEAYHYVTDGGERAHISWTARAAPGIDEVFYASVRWDGSDPAEARRVAAAESLVGGPAFDAEGAVWIETSDFERAEVLRADRPDVRATFTESGNRGSAIVTLPEGGFAAVTGEASRAFRSSTRIVFRRLALRELQATDAFEVTEGRCDIEQYRVVRGEAALAVTWVDLCDGVRRLRVRVRRSR